MRRAGVPPGQVWEPMAYSVMNDQFIVGITVEVDRLVASLSVAHFCTAGGRWCHEPRLIVSLFFLFFPLLVSAVRHFSRLSRFHIRTCSVSVFIVLVISPCCLFMPVTGNYLSVSVAFVCSISLLPL